MNRIQQVDRTKISGKTKYVFDAKSKTLTNPSDRLPVGKTIYTCPMHPQIQLSAWVRHIFTARSQRFSRTCFRTPLSITERSISTSNLRLSSRCSFYLVSGSSNEPESNRKGHTVSARARRQVCSPFECHR